MGNGGSRGRVQRPHGQVSQPARRHHQATGSGRSRRPVLHVDPRPRLGGASAEVAYRRDRGPTMTTPPAALPSVRVEITQGNLNSGHVYITKLLRAPGFLPGDIFGPPNEKDGRAKEIVL